MLLAALGVVAALLFSRTAPRTLRAAGIVTVGALALAAVAAPSLLPFQPDSRDQLARVAQFYRRAGAGEPVLEFSRWDPVGRVEIYSWRGQFMRAPADLPFKVFTQDAGAASTLFGLGTLPGGDVRVFDDSVYGVASLLRPRSDILIIGLGGGPDVQAALRHGARSITGVEINGTAAHIAAGPFAKFLGDPYHQPGVTIVVQDGRSYVAAAKRQWDVLQMSGTDTLTVQSSGASVLAESYLYTVEAFLDYLHVLRPDGILSILRFGVEPFRLGAIATRALLRLGVADPSDYVVVLGQGRMRLTLVKKRPWTEAELGALDAIAARSVEANAGIIFPPYDLWEYKLGAPLEVLYAPRRPDNRPGLARVLAEAAVDGSAAQTAPTDDRPFSPLQAVQLPQGRHGGAGGGQQIPAYLGFISVLLVVSLVLRLGPLIPRRRKGLRGGRSWITLAYFFLLGACYMLIEIVLLQKTVLLVEHPAYSVSVVLASLLLFSALGSWLSERLRVAPGRLALGAVLMIVVAGAVLVFAGERLFARPAAPALRRAGRGRLLLAPFGTAMGTSSSHATAGRRRRPVCPGHRRQRAGLGPRHDPVHARGDAHRVPRPAGHRGGRLRPGRPGLPRPGRAEGRRVVSEVTGDGAAPAAPARSPWKRAALPAAFAALVVVQLAALFYFEPPGLLFSDVPASGRDLDTHIEQTWRFTEAFDGWGKTWSYDPHLLAGWPNGTIFDADNKGWELWTWAWTKLGVPRGVAFNLFLLFAHLAVPWVVFFSARLFGLRRGTALLAGALGLALWYADGFLHWAWWGGMTAYTVSAYACLLPVAFFFRYLADRRIRHAVGLAATLPLVHLIHPYAFFALARRCSGCTCAPSARCGPAITPWPASPSPRPWRPTPGG